MFELSLYDRLGNELNLGDIVKISSGERGFHFFAEVKYLEDEQVITPFHTFSFHSFEKVSKLPDGVVESTETRYKIWWMENIEEDFRVKEFEDYLMGWRECEHLLEKRCYRIKKIIKTKSNDTKSNDRSRVLVPELFSGADGSNP